MHGYVIHMVICTTEARLEQFTLPAQCMEGAVSRQNRHEGGIATRSQQRSGDGWG